MTDDRPFTHPNFGNQTRVEVWGNEVRLIFVANDRARAESLADYLLDQLKNGAVNFTMMGRPTNRALAVSSTDRCAKCGYPRAEHSYNGVCYGLCGEFVSWRVIKEDDL